jgi:AraC-like DNA-binding protein
MHREERWHSPALTASGNQDKLFRDPDMAPKREEQVRRDGSTLRGQFRVAGDLKLASDLKLAGDVMASLASRFVLEEHGRWKTAVARPANAIGLSLEAGGIESEFHSHAESQLMYQVRGELTCEASDALWIVPPQSALWVPGGVSHRIQGRAPLEGYSVFVDPRANARLPRECCAVMVSTLFRELLFRLAARPAEYDVDGPDARLVAVLLDELAAAKVENHRLPMPAEPRLRRLVEAMVADPADASTADTWAHRIGVGERTLNRLLVKETGLSFGRWRQRLHVTLAIQRMARGASVRQVATDLGYGSASSFVTMFKKALGTSPARYMAHRLEGA